MVDLPADRQPVRGLPAPYWYTISVSAIRAVDFDEKGDLTYVLVQFAPDRCGGIDAINYYLFERSTASNGQRVWTQTSQSPHGLGQVPARFLWNDADESQLVRQGILTALKSDLDWLLFWQTSKKQYDLGAAYEMTWLMQPECTFTPTNGKRCQSGIVEVYNETTDKFIPVKCPACKARKRLGGIGSVLELPIPISKDQPDLRPPAGRIPAEEVSLKYITAEQERLEQVLFRQATSQRPDVTAEAINEKQVGQQADNEEAVLQYFAEGLSDARTWLWQTVATLRYGPQRFQGAATSYGTRFTAIDRGAIAQQLTDGTALPVWAKGDLLDKLRTALANGNARHRNRLDLLAMLEPWQELSLDDARTMGLDQTDPPAFALKADFTRRLGWLEAEHGDIMLIMADATPITRFKFILNLLYGYGQTDFLGSVRTADRPGPVDNGSAPGTDQPPAAGNTRAAQYEPA